MNTRGALAPAFASSFGLASSVTSRAERYRAMRIYIFKSETRSNLLAFAGDLMGSKLPESHGPWTATGAIGPEKAPPHNFSRDAIESAIDAEGFQLWRLATKTQAEA
jgi:hypothetical protein